MAEREIEAPKVKNITTETTFIEFESLLLIDAGSSGFRVKDSADNVIVIPTGIPYAVAGPMGRISGPLTVMAPASGTLNVSASYYSVKRV